MGHTKKGNSKANAGEKKTNKHDVRFVRRIVAHLKVFSVFHFRRSVPLLRLAVPIDEILVGDLIEDEVVELASFK